MIKQKYDWLTRPQPGHLVQFYQSDKELLEQLASFIGTGVRKNDACVVIATKDHVQGLTLMLLRRDIDVTAAKLNGTLTIFDAGKTLDLFMVDGMPDKALFDSVIGRTIKNISLSGNPIRAYGEMVALLWNIGNKDAVIALENLWNDLAEKYDFALFCAYPMLHFVMHGEELNEIRECHNVNLTGTARV
jgi:hypothetical protein